MDGNYDNSDDRPEQPVDSRGKRSIFYISFFAICAIALTSFIEIKNVSELDIYSGRRRTVLSFMGIPLHTSEEVTKVALLLAADPHDNVHWVNCGSTWRNVLGGNRAIGCNTMGGLASMMRTLEGYFETFEVPDKDAARLARAYLTGVQRYHHDRSCFVYFDMSNDFNSLTIFINDEPVETWTR